ncbi:hypothetical protein [Aquimarina sediminis]|uniref:hypothetical protein n=1 Tax=Aquimarina sediminis TaxID=2070536 RepID=UPI000FFE3D94|nr:hypothetical protein [Aquimarina sediminis]
MNYTINYSEINYKKDYKNYLFHSRRKQWYPIFGCLLLSGLIFLTSFFPIIEFDIKGIAFASAILGVILLFFELLYTYSALKSINQSSQKFKSGSENLIIEATQIKLSYGKTNYESIFYSQIKRCLILKNVMFIVLKSEKDWPVRINKSEIGEEGFSELIALFKSKKTEL